MRYALVTFDVYSALCDVTGSLLPYLVPLCQDNEEAARNLIGEWRRLQLEYTLIASLLERGHVPFRVITARALDVALHRHGVVVAPRARERLISAWEQLTPWPEVPRVLAEVKARGYTIAVLSNGDEQMLRAQVQHFHVSFDHIFAADQAGVYKPHPAIYHLPVRRLGLAPSQILHVAGAARDVMGAKAAGLACFWVNRSGDRVLDPALNADSTAPDLTGLLALLT